MRRLVRLLLRLYPQDFREAREDEVLDFVEKGRRAARARGPLVLAGFWLRTLWDLARSAVRMRRTGPGSPERDMSLDLMMTTTGGEGMMGSMMQDLRYAVRSLARSPVLTVVVVTTLGLAVGMNVGIFSVVSGVLLEPLEYREPGELVEVVAHVSGNQSAGQAAFSSGDVRAIRGGVTAFQGVAEVGVIRQNLTGAGLPRQVEVGWTTHHLFPLLGVEAALGRTFGPDDPPGTAVLSHGLWQDRFGSDPGVLGSSVSLDGHPFTVVGVLPRGSRLHLPGFPDVQLWKNPDSFWQNGDIWTLDGPSMGFFQVVARLAEGAEREQAQAEVGRVAADLRSRWEEYDRVGLELEVVALHERLVGDLRTTLLLLAGAVGLVLLIACANVANLLLVRAQRRHRELAVRLALGSSRGRLARLLLAESLVLALAGGAVGVALGAWSTRLLEMAGPAVPRADTVSMDLRVLGFALAVSVVCTVLVGLAPALTAARGGVARILRGSRGVARGDRGLRDGLVVAQIALSLVLFVGAGLLTGSLVRLQSVEPGFDPEGVLSVSVSIPGARYDWPEEADRFFRELEGRIETLPGVREVGTMWPLPMMGRWRSVYEAGEIRGEDRVFGDYRVGTEGYFRALDVPLLEGRLFRESDPREVVVVSESLARRAWPGRPAVGRALRANPWGGDTVAFQVVGVVGDIRQQSLREAPRGELYFEMGGWAWTDWEFNVVVRSDAPAEILVPRIREVMGSMDPEIPVASPITLSEFLDRKLAPNRFALALVGLFSGVAGLLALVGLYGVVSYSVGMRTREIGVRMALGSARTAVTRLVLGQGMRLVALGVGLGVLGALGLTRLLSGYLFGVEPTDPWTYAAVAVTLSGLAALATWIPARRAARVDPASVLRID